MNEYFSQEKKKKTYVKLNFENVLKWFLVHLTLRACGTSELADGTGGSLDTSHRKESDGTRAGNVDVR